MAIAFSASDIRFRGTFALATGYLTFTDLLENIYNPTYGWTKANVRGICKITAPNGSVIYANTYWAAITFGSADIDGNTDTWALGSLTIPTDADGDPLTGNYIFEYYVTQDNGVTTYYATKTYTYGFVAPVVSIDMEMDCPTSIITSEDTTDYDVDNVTPTITRTHLLTKPVGAGCNTPTSTTSATATFGGGGTALTDVWTGVWQSTISSVLSYNAEAWGIYTWIIITETVTGGDSLEVACDDCACDIRECLNALIDLWKEYLGEDKKRADRLETKVLQAVAAYMNFLIAERCGEDYTTYCNEIADIIADEDCDCMSAVDEYPTRVVPTSVSQSSSGVECCVWSSGTITPTGGSAGDFYVRKDSASPPTYLEIWENVAGEWILLADVFGTGDTGDQGDTGDTGDTGTGVTGDKGDTGDIVTGDTGDTGSQIFNSAINPNVIDGANGDYHFNTVTKNLWYKTGGIWTDLGTLGGDTGDKGDTGDTGTDITGTKGDTGDTGVGITGDTGDTGVGITGDTGDTGDGSVLLEASYTLTTANLTADLTGNVEILAAPGANLLYDIVSVVAYIDPVGAAFTAGADIKLRWDGDATDLYLIAQAFVQGGGSGFDSITPTASGNIQLANTAVVAYSAVNFATGSGSMKLYILYRLLDVS